MKIIKLTAQNLQILKAIEITTPEENVIRITGKNAQGKSTVMDAIYYALAGKSANPVKPIRNSEKEASVTIEFGEFLVTRKWTDSNDASKSYLNITTKDKTSKFNSPQALLDSFIGSLSFDPLKFAEASDKEQRNMLLELVNIGIDLDQWQKDRDKIYNERTIINRSLTALKGQLAGMMTPVQNAPKVPVSVGELSAKLQDAFIVKRNNEDKRRAFADKQSQLEALRQRVIELEEETDILSNALMGLVDPPIEEIQDQILNAESVNKTVANNQTYYAKQAELRTVEEQSKDMTVALDELDKSKITALKNAKFPIDGLSFESDYVIYRGTPLSQISSAEKLRVSMAVAMAYNPKLRVIRIENGSLLDSNNLAIIEQMAKDNDFQIWLESVDESGKIGIVIEDGEIKQNNYQTDLGV